MRRYSCNGSAATMGKAQTAVGYTVHERTSQSRYQNKRNDAKMGGWVAENHRRPPRRPCKTHAWRIQPWLTLLAAGIPANSPACGAARIAPTIARANNKRRGGRGQHWPTIMESDKMIILPRSYRTYKHSVRTSANESELTCIHLTQQMN